MNIASLKQRARLIVKTSYLWLYVHVYAALRNAWLAQQGKCHVAVLLYHRISNYQLDSVTVTPEQFSRQLSLLSHEYDLIDIKEFFAHRGEPRKRPAVVITFDDGYEDNYSAAQLLRAKKAPCTFFISTGIVDSERVFPKDARMNRRLPVLSWQQLADMSSWGFHIANHTVNHIDMGAVPVENSLDEILTATRIIVDKLGQKGAERWLAFPFGRLHNMKKEVQEQLHAVGIDFCFSAYGGVNKPDVNPLDIVRQPISHEFSDLAFQAVVEGYRILQ